MDETLIAFWVFAAVIIGINLWVGLEGSAITRIVREHAPAVEQVSPVQPVTEQIAIGAD